MKQAIASILRRYGTDVNLVQNGVQETVSAFFQPCTARTAAAAQRDFGPLGEMPGRSYLYIGPAKPAIKPEDEITVADRAYTVRCAEIMPNRMEPLYCWGLCVRKGEEEEA